MQLLLGDKLGPPAKKRPYSSVWFVPELMHVIAMCEERLPLVELGEEVITIVVNNDITQHLSPVRAPGL